MKDAFDVLMITHSSLCKGYEGALKLILDIDDDDFGTLSFENAESLEDFSEKIKTMIDGVYKDRNLVVLLDLPGGITCKCIFTIYQFIQKIYCGYQSSICFRTYDYEEKWHFLGRAEYRRNL